jgi:hypothetical protein
MKMSPVFRPLLVALHRIESYCSTRKYSSLELLLQSIQKKRRAGEQ